MQNVIAGGLLVAMALAAAYLQRRYNKKAYPPLEDEGCEYCEKEPGGHG